MISWFYSDPHFGHRNIIEYCARPFDSVEHMDSELIRRYQEVVKPSDVVCWVGTASAWDYAPVVVAAVFALFR